MAVVLLPQIPTLGPLALEAAGPVDPLGPGIRSAERLAVSQLLGAAILGEAGTVQRALELGVPGIPAVPPQRAVTVRAPEGQPWGSGRPRETVVMLPLVVMGIWGARRLAPPQYLAEAQGWEAKHPERGAPRVA